VRGEDWLAVGAAVAPLVLLVIAGAPVVQRLLWRDDDCGGER
jgi:heme exporter protein D